MDTLIVEIRLPAINRSDDYVLPAHIPVAAILPSLAEVVRMNTGADVIDPERPMLCFLHGKRPIPPDKTLSQAGVRDSAKLMLI